MRPVRPDKSLAATSTEANTPDGVEGATGRQAWPRWPTTVPWRPHGAVYEEGVWVSGLCGRRDTANSPGAVVRWGDLLPSATIEEDPPMRPVPPKQEPDWAQAPEAPRLKAGGRRRPLGVASEATTIAPAAIERRGNPNCGEEGW